MNAIPEPKPAGEAHPHGSSAAVIQAVGRRVMTPAERHRILGWCWFGHGISIVLLTGIAWAFANFYEQSELWAEIGLVNVYHLMSSSFALLRGWSVSLLATAGLCMMGGLLLLRWPTPGRIILHLAAIVHFVGIPWMTWLIIAEQYRLGYSIQHLSIVGGSLAIGTIIGVIASSLALERGRVATSHEKE